MSIAEKLTYLQTTKQLLKTEINKINNVLTDNSTFRSYSQQLFNGYLDILNNGTDTLWSNLEKVSQTGTEAVLEGVETAPMKIELSGNTSQDGEPTPDTPVEVKVVKGENVVSVSGKNLVDKNKVVASQTTAVEIVETGFKATLLTAGVYKYAGIKLGGSELLGKQLMLRALMTPSSANNGGVYIYYGNANNPAINTANFNINGSGYKEVTKALADEFPNNCDGVYLLIYANLDGTGNAGDYVEYTNLQVEYGSTATPYVPYSKTDYPINLGDIELCKINTYKDYFHKDSGKWYVHKEIEKVVLDGSEGWEYSSKSNIPTPRSVILLSSYIDFQSLIYYSNHFTNDDENTSNRLRFYVQQSNYRKDIYLSLDNEIVGISSGDSNATRLQKIKTWLSTHNTIVYYVLATPTETEITNTTLIEQLEAISKAKSVKDKTYITQTNDGLPFILDVEAIKEYEVN